MPFAPARPCRAPNCRHVVTHNRTCPVHGQAATGMRWDTDRRQDVVRLRGRANQSRRQRLFARSPLCVTCEVAGRVTLATIADHVIPLAEGGKDDESNLAPVCAACHLVKVQAEAARGLRRNR